MKNVRRRNPGAPQKRAPRFSSGARYQTGYAKPHPEIFRTALRTLGVTAESTVLVGDNLEDDVLASKSIGIRAVLLDRSGRYADLDSVPKIQDLQQLLTVCQIRA